jgi:molybdenum cofactor synthesis domain-containing protein
MIGPQEALDLVLHTTSILPPRPTAIEDAWGLTLAEDILADCDCPPFRRAMMDGYAVRLSGAGRTLPVAGEIAAGSVWHGDFVDGMCLEILTGAPCPAGTEAVVPKEQVRRQADHVTLPDSISRDQNIAAVGSECRRGERVLHAGMRISPMAVGTLASFGVAQVQAIPRPTLGIISTGGEFAPPGELPGPGQIRNSNGPMLRAMAREQGIDAPLQFQSRDSLEEILQALDSVSGLDIILLTGGVSVGKYDLVPAALADYGAEAVFHGVNQKPGKPLFFAKKDRQLIFGLPGNPLSCHFGFHRYVAAAIRKMSGRSSPTSLLGALTQSVRPKGRPQFIPGRAYCGTEKAGTWQLEILSAVSAADIFRGCEANCYVEVPLSDRTLEPGDVCSFTWLGRPPWDE